jgi:hypothetical protein
VRVFRNSKSASSARETSSPVTAWRSTDSMSGGQAAWKLQCKDISPHLPIPCFGGRKTNVIHHRVHGPTRCTVSRFRVYFNTLLFNQYRSDWARNWTPNTSRYDEYFRYCKALQCGQIHALLAVEWGLKSSSNVVGKLLVS